MTYQEPERLALQIQELMERRAVLRAMLEQRLADGLTDSERGDIQRVIDILDRDMADLRRRLRALQGG